MKSIPPQHHNKFLTFLNDVIQTNDKLKEVCAERAVSDVELEHLGGMDYTIVNFKDGCSLIIAGAYSQFETSIHDSTPPGAA